VLAQSEINIVIGDKAPEICFAELAEQCAGGKKSMAELPIRWEYMRTSARTAYWKHCTAARSRLMTTFWSSAASSWR
jgi:predicted Fe-S protein YdhL (DUF1289 family)